MRTVNETDITSIEKMREEELKEQIEIWKTKYEETQSKIDDDNNKINEYKEKIENNQEASELLKTNFQMKTVLGKQMLKVKVLLLIYLMVMVKVNSEDLIKLVNELKLAGAEAISINDERIINLTDIVDVNSYVIINGQRTESPFKIKAIGDQQYLNEWING